MSQSTALVARLPRPAFAQHISPRTWQLLTDVVWPGARDPAVIATAFAYCAERKLDPLKRPIHIVPVYSRTLRRRVEGIWSGIGELEITAARSGVWAGMDPPEWGPMMQRTFKGEFENDDGSTRKVEVSVEFPEWCQVTIYRFVRDQRFAFAEPVYWLEAYGHAGFRSEVPKDMWVQRPRGQLHKCAKAASLRAAFPEDIGSDYTDAEMEGQEVDHLGPTIDGKAEPPPPEPQPSQPSSPTGGADASGNGGWERPDYGLRLPDGTSKVLHTGTEYLDEWRAGLERLGDRRDVIRRVRELNRSSLAAIANFDPEAAAEVEQMLDAALKEPEA